MRLRTGIASPSLSMRSLGTCRVWPPATTNLAFWHRIAGGWVKQMSCIVNPLQLKKA